MTAAVNSPMNGSRRSIGGAVAVVVAGAMLAAVIVVGGLLGGAVVSAQELGPDDLPITTVFNDFYPTDRDLSDCLSVLPRPGCGSAARSGWPQLVVFGLILVGVGAVATRVIVSARRNRTSPATGPDAASPSGRTDPPATGQSTTDEASISDPR